MVYDHKDWKITETNGESESVCKKYSINNNIDDIGKTDAFLSMLSSTSTIHQT